MTPSAADHLVQLQALLPQGPAWPREPDAMLTKLLAGFAPELARFDARSAELLEEIDVRTSAELLADWEAVLGLPDRCAAATSTSLDGRRISALRKLAYQAGHTPAFYRSLAAALGYDVEIHEFDPAVDTYDGSLTPLITGGRWRFVWRMHVLTPVSFRLFRVGHSRVGDSLREGGAHELECVITAAKQSHTHVIFTYEES
jgi:uncharacterized protein YmfQ (DUF2313 family)